MTGCAAQGFRQNGQKGWRAFAGAAHRRVSQASWLRRLGGSAAALAAAAASLVLLGTNGLQDAIANGDTRSITILHTHTKESATVTFRRDGVYVREGLDKLNHLLRDWRQDEKTNMDPRLFDIVWQVHREVGSSEPIHVVSAYRSPMTNSMLRRRSRGVAKHSQHMLGKAMDFYLPDADMARVRAVAMRLQHGGVGFYPGAFNPFVHLDSGSVRSWPRMPRDQLARLFPDGRTVHIPRDGKPMDGFELAKADILARGGAVAGLTYAEANETPAESGSRRSFWASLFGGADEDEDNAYENLNRRGTPAGRRTASAASQVTAYAPAGSHDSNAGMYAAFAPLATAPSRATRPAPSPSAPAAVPATPEASPPVAGAASTLAPVDPLSGGSAPKPTARPVELTPLRPGDAEGTRLAALAAGASGAAPGLEAGLTAIVPLPPRRPEDMPALATLVDLPAPPVRPQEFAALGGNPAGNGPIPTLRGSAGDLAALAAAASGPALIVAPVVHPEPPMRPVAFAVASPEPARPIRVETTAAVPAPANRGDPRQDLRNLFAAISAETQPRRDRPVATARTRPAATPAVSIAAPSTVVVTRFGMQTQQPMPDRFSGPSVRPLPTATLARP